VFVLLMNLVYCTCSSKKSNYQKRSIKCRKRYFLWWKHKKTK